MKGMKKINLTTFVLLAYLVVMSIIGWPGDRADRSYISYFAVIGATLLIIFLLRYLQIKRYHLRQKRREEKDEK